MSRNENEQTAPSADPLTKRIMRLENINNSLAMTIADLNSQVKNLRERMDKLEANR
jgi:uncharacterized coiled-coil protein SlyX